MDPLSALALVVALVVIATVAGLVWRTTSGRARRGSEDVVTAEHLGLPSADVFGEHATLVQFSTEFCGRCPGTRTLLGAIVETRRGVAHLDIDLTHRPDIASSFDVRQTPTTLVLDSAGRLRARIGGAPRRSDVISVLDDIAEGSTAPTSTKEAS